MEIAKTIMSQIKATTPTPVLWSWGASKFQAVKENQIEGLDHVYLGGLLFYVRGKNHTGHVMVTLEPNDTYRVTIGHVRKGKMNVKSQMADVYFDTLSDTIDSLVEYQENYRY